MTTKARPVNFFLFLLGSAMWHVKSLFLVTAIEPVRGGDTDKAGLNPTDLRKSTDQRLWGQNNPKGYFIQGEGKTM